MSQPFHHRINAAHQGAWRRLRAGDHDHRQAKRAGCIQLGPRTLAACVLGDDMRDAVGLHQADIVGQRERAAQDDSMRVRQRKAIGRIDQAQKIVEVWPGRKPLQPLPSDGEEDARRSGWQGNHGGSKIANLGPAVALDCLPRRAFQRDQGQIECCAGRDGVAAHLAGEGVGGVNHRRDCVLAQIVRQPADTAKPSDPRRQGLLHGRLGASGVGIDGRDARICQAAREQAGLGCAAKQKDGGRHG